ncbi:MAG: bifunctional metallophosphatase/5'-nucleotidase [Myxococcaceae bacterium]
MIRRLLTAAVVLASASSLSCLPTVEGPDLNLAGQEVRLTILHTSDIHSRLVPYDFAPLKTDVDLGLIPDAAPYGGATRVAALLKRERKKADRVLHLDSGDAFQGAPIFNLKSGEAEYKFLSLIGLDAAVIGNHEFDAGAANFTQKARDFAGFPVMAANYIWNDYREGDSNQTALVTQPYSLFNVKGVRVGVIGMANLSSLNSIVEGGNSLQITPLEQNEAARSYVDLLKPVTDLLIVVSHLGLTEDQDLIQGYEAFYEQGKIKSYLNRATDPWQILEYFGPKEDDKTVVRVKIPGVSGLDLVLGGHLHVVLNPPQLLSDPSGRKVVLSHSGAFAKYVGRMDMVLKMPPKEGAVEGAEILSHDYKVFPIDSVWCDDEARQLYNSKFWNPGEYRVDPTVLAAKQKCVQQEDTNTLQLLTPYLDGLDVNFGLTQIFSYAPRDVSRRNNSTGGDSPLGNFAADSMRKRQRVDAQVGLTNSLGIRDNLYAGPITQESMFNVFPFENTINIMYLSGSEMQELFDFIAERSASRGCQSQAQISGATFTMDCAQVQINDLRTSCNTQKSTDPAVNGSDCPGDNEALGHARWQCLDDVTGGRCWAHPGIGIQVNGQALDPFGTYKIAVNDYIAKGGSGFQVLKRNTSRIETGISLRDSLIGYMQGFCNCNDLLNGSETSASGQVCGNIIGGQRVVDDQAVAFCQGARKFELFLQKPVGDCTCQDVLEHNARKCNRDPSDDLRDLAPSCVDSPDRTPGPALARCSCFDALTGNTDACGFVTAETRAFCENPTKISVAIGFEDGRIGRRVK